VSSSSTPKNPAGLIGIPIAFVFAAALFGGLEWMVRKGWLGRRAPDHPYRSRSSREKLQDVLYWAVTPLLSKTVSRVGVGLVLVALAWRFGHGAAGVKAMIEHLHARSPVARLPFGAQLLLGLFTADLIAYGSHRAFHRGRLWPFHAVHHSSETLDWLAATRLHPVNELVTKLFQVVPLVFLGFDPKVFGAVAPILTAWAVFIHSDVPWQFGPLRFVIATPRFHRWHHTSASEGRDKNFAGLFPFWDLVFGTFYMPAHEPTVFGADEEVPDGILAQLAWPFRRKAPGPVTASQGAPIAR
jgi:sterol desaturase/sphingolipid hydroxylase (fatty acid hydroxylase superfamily)